MDTITHRPWRLPWTIIVLEVYWLWAAFGFVFFAVSWHSVPHFIMALLAVSIVVAQYLRWRPGFWISALGSAAALGGTIARIIVAHIFFSTLLISVGIALEIILIQQASLSLSWFDFKNVRRVRLWFWALSALSCIISEYLMVQLLSKRA
jgi:hypothetical protein